MKNSNLIIVVGIALLAGYFAYPYFNPKSESPQVNSTQLEKGDSQIRKKSPSVQNDLPLDQTDITSSDNAPSIEEKSTAPSEETNKRNASEATSNTNESEKKKNSGYSSLSTFSGSGGYKLVRDYSSYTLKSKDRIAIAPGDPRFDYIKGYYQGHFDGNVVDLEIRATESSIRFSDNEVLSFGSDNDTFFTNVNEDGNKILMQNGDTKIFLDIKDWPRLKLLMGLKTVIHLEKAR